MERNQKNIEKTKKQKKKQYLETLGENPLWPRSLEYCVFCFFLFSQRFLHFWARKPKNIEKTKKNKKQKYLETLGGTPPIPKTSGICFFVFFFVFSIFFLLCANPPHPQDLWNIFFCFCRCFCWFVPIPPIPKTFKKNVLFFLFRDKIELFYVLNFFSPVAISSSQSLPHWSSVLQHGPGALYFSSRFATKS